MRYWWVNQNQTHRQEIGGGYLWSVTSWKQSPIPSINKYFFFMAKSPLSILPNY